MAFFFPLCFLEADWRRLRVPSFLSTESPETSVHPRLTPAPAAPVFLSFPSENPRSFDGLQGNTPAPAPAPAPDSLFPGGCLHLLCTRLSKAAPQYVYQSRAPFSICSDMNGHERQAWSNHFLVCDPREVPHHVNSKCRLFVAPPSHPSLSVLLLRPLAQSLHFLQAQGVALCSKDISPFSFHPPDSCSLKVLVCLFLCVCMFTCIQCPPEPRAVES